VAAVAAGALCALQHLHQDCHMLHRDLKAANFLLTRAGALKLADFGVSVQLSTTLSKRSTAIGTPHWTTPNPNPKPQPHPQP
jgi:serine/threonine-protein kinase 24/25/MST4